MAIQTEELGPRNADGGGVDPKAKAQEVAGQAQEKAQAAAGQVQDRLREQLDHRSAQVAAQINEQASDLRSVSHALREEGKDGPAKAAARIASYGERVGGYLRDKDADALLRDAEDFGRRKPAAVVAGGLVVGFAAARFLKASSSQRYSSASSGQLSRPRPDSAMYDELGGGPPPGAAQPPGDGIGGRVHPPLGPGV